MAICPHRITGLCFTKEFYSKCGHGDFHKSIECEGGTCLTREGVCALTNYYVKCILLSDIRRAQFAKIFAEEK